MKRFVKNVEDFECQKCGNTVKGSGYTNHCPKCLWSKHVDVNPGDRMSECGGMMEPLKVEQEGKEYVITHKCIVCGYMKRNRAEESDDFDELVRVSKENNNKYEQ